MSHIDIPVTLETNQGPLEFVLAMVPYDFFGSVAATTLSDGDLDERLMDMVSADGSDITWWQFDGELADHVNQFINDRLKSC